MGKHDDILLEVRDLQTQFRTDEGVAQAVSGVDFVLKRGETLGLVGESGCGKSVTALSIIRLIPDPPGRIVGGQVMFNGRDLLGLSESEMRSLRGGSISMIFQEPMTSLNPVFRIGDLMSEVIRLHHDVTRAEAKDRSSEMLRSVGISDPARRLRDYPHEISGGMRQRVMIAMALSSQPEMLIADEPTTALDVTIQAQILDLINVLKEKMGTSNLFITHDLGVIAKMAQKVAVMYTGRIVENAVVGELFRHPLHPYTQGLIASIPNMTCPVPPDRMLKTIPGTVPSLFRLLHGCSFQDRCIRVMDRCRRKAPELIDAGAGHLVRCWLYE